MCTCSRSRDYDLQIADGVRKSKKLWSISYWNVRIMMGFETHVCRSEFIAAAIENSDIEPEIFGCRRQNVGTGNENQSRQRTLKVRDDNWKKNIYEKIQISTFWNHF